MYKKAGGTVTVVCTLRTLDSVRNTVRNPGGRLVQEQHTLLFQQVNSLGQEAHAEQCTGIGLVVCKRLIELMKGSIGMESTVGEGSVSRVELKEATGPQIITCPAEFTACSDAHVKGGAQLYALLYVEEHPANNTLELH